MALTESLRQVGIVAKYVASDEPDRAKSNEMIDGSSLVLVLVSYDAMKSRTVRADIERAVQNGATILPVRADRARIGGYVKSVIGKDLVLTTDNLSEVVEAAQRAYRRGCPIISVMNMKGGVGKTTIAAQLAGTLQATQGNRVLLIDFDPQYNLSQLFFSGGEPDAAAAEDRSVISLFEKSKLHEANRLSPADRWGSLYADPFTPAPKEKIAQDLLDTERAKGRLDLIFGQFEISKYAFSTDTEGLEAVRTNFLRSLDYYRGLYDLIVLDTNPNATFLTRCALEAADRVLAPMHSDVYSLRGIKLLNRVIEDQTISERRPAVSIVFNSVEAREQSDFEADTRNGAFDEQVGFALSHATLQAALPRSRHFRLKTPEGTAPIKQLLVHHGRGGGLKQVRQALEAVATELNTELADV
ncbi:MAG: AAA family ATPase [Pseudomonadota bacterium]